MLAFPAAHNSGVWLQSSAWECLIPLPCAYTEIFRVITPLKRGILFNVMIAKSPEKNKIESWGTDESYWGLNLRPARLEQKDIDFIRTLSPSSRLEWLLMMQKLLIAQFGFNPKE